MTQPPHLSSEPTPSVSLEQRIEQLLVDWEAHNATEEDDEFGRERYSKMEDCIADLRAVLRPAPEANVASSTEPADLRQRLEEKAK